MAQQCAKNRVLALARRFCQILPGSGEPFVSPLRIEERVLSAHAGFAGFLQPAALFQLA